MDADGRKLEVFTPFFRPSSNYVNVKFYFFLVYILLFFICAMCYICWTSWSNLIARNPNTNIFLSNPMINLNRNSNPNEKRYKIINLYFLVCLFSIPFHLCFLFFSFPSWTTASGAFLFFSFVSVLFRFVWFCVFFPLSCLIFFTFLASSVFYQASVRMFGFPWMLLRLLRVWVSFRPNTHQNCRAHV
jgi:hypothetical protein